MDDFAVGQMVWLVVNGVRQVKLKVVELGDPLKCRFPDGHIEEVFQDELEIA